MPTGVAVGVIEGRVGMAVGVFIGVGVGVTVTEGRVGMAVDVFVGVGVGVLPAVMMSEPAAVEG